jgi:hypothetical protein
MNQELLSACRIPTIDVLNAELSAWHTRRNLKQKAMQRHFATADARTKLKRLYPEFVE